MRIIFICSSVELGFDGVGDYTQYLAAELLRLGAKVEIVAINDRKIDHEYSGTHLIGSTDLAVLRLPSRLPSSYRFKKLKQRIEQFNPHWISLQYVNFAYQNKGLPILLGKKLHDLSKGRRWHIMFHELWLGIDAQASKKYVVWGQVQRFIIKSMISTLKPTLVHTQSLMHQSVLSHAGIRARLLPLFSSIPKVTLIDKGSCADINNIRMVVFGTIYSNAPIFQFTEEVASYVKNNNVRVQLIFLGNSRTSQKEWVKVWKYYGLNVELVGEQTPEVVSEILQSASIAISTTPYALSDKSSSIAAYKAHNLPILCVANSWHPRTALNIPIVKGIYVYEPGKLNIFFNEKLKAGPLDTLLTVAKQFMADITNV